MDDDFCGEPLVSIYTVLRVEIAGDTTDPDSVLWQPIKRGGSVLTVSQWKELVAHVDRVETKIEELEAEAE